VFAKYPGLASPSGAHSIAKSIAFNGADMYVVGGRAHEAAGTVWKNGVATALTQTGAPEAIVVTGSIAPPTYIAGTDYNSTTAYLWKNNVRYQLSALGTASEVKVSDNFAYVSGIDATVGGGYNRAVYWKFDPAKNVEVNVLSDGSQFAFAAAIAVSGSDVYVAGLEEDDNQYYVAKIWINGEAHVLGGGGKPARRSQFDIHPRWATASQT